MVRTMSESMMRRVAGRCGAHRLQAPSGARLHGSTVPRVHGFTGSRAWERPSAGRGWRRAFPMPGTRRRNVSFDPHVYERTAPPIIESEFLQSNNRGAVQLRPRGRTSPCSRCKRKGRTGDQLSRPAFPLAYRGLTSCAARSRFGFRDGGTASIPLPRARTRPTPRWARIRRSWRVGESSSRWPGSPVECTSW